MREQGAGFRDRPFRGNRMLSNEKYITPISIFKQPQFIIQRSSTCILFLAESVSSNLIDLNTEIVHPTGADNLSGAHAVQSSHFPSESSMQQYPSLR